MNSIAIFAEDSSLFACPYLAEALDCNLYTILQQYNNFFQGGRMAIDYNKVSIKEENLITIGYVALKTIAEKIEKKHFKSVAAILSDSPGCRNYKWINDFVSRNNITVYCMPDLKSYCTGKTIPAYQTMNIDAGIINKPKKILISHSPSNTEKAVLKGTPQILEIIKQLKKFYDFDFYIIQELTMKTCLSIKKQSHIFIDQLIYKNPHVPQKRWGGEIIYNGGLGKSGIEAMFLGCCVITGGTVPETEPYFPPPPIQWTDYNNLYRDLKEILTYPVLIDHIAKEQRTWASKYLSYEFVAKHITQHLCGI